MAKKKRSTPAPKPVSDDRPITLKDLLSGEILEQLKSQADEMKAEELKKKEEQELMKAEARKQEQKKLDNNFEHLLENSNMDWHKYK
ncbi:YqkE family protein [Paenibacillus sp. FA6]|uniref:YqkE family protein n=1 Tax=Paenibacillus sp. FA6 TaxID=3413029 RepID=UPI003F6580EE